MRRGCTVVAVVVLAALTGCTVDDPTGSTSGNAAPTTVPDLLPGTSAAATDGPRPSETDVVISSLGWDADTDAVHLGGYVSPVVEDGGTCTAELTQDDRTLTVDAPGVADASTTVCAGFALAGEELAPGVWQVVLRYESSSTSGTSEPATVEVPR